MSNANGSESGPSKGQAVARGALWCFASAALISGIAFAAAGMNSKVKLLLIFALVLGALNGWLLARLARVCRLQALWFVTVLSFLLIAGGQLLHVELMHHRHAKQMHAAYRVDPMQALLTQGSLPEDPKLRREYQSLIEDNKQARSDALNELTSIQTFLQWRLSQTRFGTIPLPWVLALSAFEILAAGALGTYVLRRVQSAPHAQPRVSLDAANHVR